MRSMLLTFLAPSNEFVIDRWAVLLEESSYVAVSPRQYNVKKYIIDTLPLSNIDRQFLHGNEI